MRYHVDIRVGSERLSYFTSRKYLTIVDLPGCGQHMCYVAKGKLNYLVYFVLLILLTCM